MVALEAVVEEVALLFETAADAQKAAVAVALEEVFSLEAAALGAALGAALRALGCWSGS